MADARTISPDFPFTSHYTEVAGSKLHYIDEGAGDPVLFLHGNPTSSYIWRNIIPHMTASARCIALDLIGMGKSDQPEIEYRFVDQYRYVEGFIEAMGLQRLTLVIHDWGSALGIHYAMNHPGNVHGLAMMEPILAPIPSWEDFPADLRETFQAFRTPETGWDMIVNQNVFVEKLLPGAVIRELSEEEMNHYRAPYTERGARKPLWVWPNEIPIEGEPEDVVRIVAENNQRLQASDHPKLLFVAEPGALMREPMLQWCRDNVKHLKVVELGDGIHYLQEDHPHAIGAALADWYQEITG